MPNLPRMKIVACVPILLSLGSVPIAPAQVREAAKPPGSEHVDVFSSAGGPTRIALIKPEGARVREGETVCILEDGTRKDRMTAQVIVTRGAEAAYQNAKLVREVADLVVAEYVETTSKRELAEAEEKVKQAEVELERIKAVVGWMEQIQKKGYLLHIKGEAAARSQLKQATFALEQAITARAVFATYTKQRTIQKLKRDVETARADELVRQAAFERERAIEESMSRAKPIADRTVAAPIAGRVRYLWPITTGVVVRGGDILFRIVPEDE
jgi:HlyD family secretion protein